MERENTNIGDYKTMVKELSSKLIDEIHMSIIIEQEKLLEEIADEEQALEAYEWHTRFIRGVGIAKELRACVSGVIQESKAKIKELERKLQENEKKHGDIRRALYSEMYDREYVRCRIESLEDTIGDMERKSYCAFLCERHKQNLKQELKIFYEKMGKAEKAEWEKYKETGIKYQTLIKYKCYNEYDLLNILREKKGAERMN